MNGGIEAIAIKNLQTILKSRGISSEALFSKYDINDDGSLDKTEFEAALSSITGQKAPDSIVNAIFSALDSDGDGRIDLQEILVLIERGSSPSYAEGTSLDISDHPNMNYNGRYNPGGEINGKPLFVNDAGSRLYYYNAGSGGAPSWSLDDREQDGTNDYYRGGWTRPPSSGELPLGTRRWVGVGKISIQTSPAAEVLAEISNEVTEIEVVEENKSESPSDLMDSVSGHFSEIIENTQFTPSSDAEVLMYRGKMDEQAELKISKLPSFLQPSARELWRVKADSYQQIILQSLTSAEGAAVGLSVAAVGASVLKSKVEDTESIEQDISVPMSENNDASEGVVEKQIESPKGLVSPVTNELVDEPASTQVNTILSIIESFSGARMLSEQNSLKEELSGTQVDISMKVLSIERTFGIGISETYRGGNTVIASLIGQGDALSGHSVEIRIPSDVDNSAFKVGYELNITGKVSGWNSIRKRVILDSQ